jgi:hypothetical protein
VPVPRSYGKSIRISRTRGELPLEELPPARRHGKAPAPTIKPPIDTFLSLCAIARNEASKRPLDEALRRRLTEARAAALRAAGTSQKKRRRVENADAALRAALAQSRPQAARSGRQPPPRRASQSTMDGGFVPAWEQRPR